MKKQDIKTIDVLTKTWFDRFNGNTYFAQIITINYRMKDEVVLKNPFQYGYSSYDYFAIECISKQLDIEFSGVYILRENGIIFRSILQKNCKKRELKNI